MALRIEDYALIGDMQSAALVGRDGSIDWLCLPRFDSGAVFAGLLGSDENGHWRVAPTSGGLCTRRRYRQDTFILETEWETAGGVVRVTDFMPPRSGNPDVVRVVEGLAGSVPMTSTLRMRFDYGHVVPWVRRTGNGDLAAVAGPDSLWLHGDVEHRGRDFASVGHFTVEHGQRRSMVLTWQPSHQPEPVPADSAAACAVTDRFWRWWGDHCSYDGPHRDAVRRSLLVLKALTYEPTGGIVAAATTSLPEEIGGVRNWDYRFCWLRDATLTLQALVRSGYLEEAEEWRDWLLRAIAGSPADLQIMYGVAGERRLPEYDATWLPGYEGSRPVRIGNAAAEQLQLDVYGEVVDALALARAAGMQVTEDAWHLQRSLVTWLEDHWHKPDEGLWEVRGPRRHFVHSKVLAWAAFDRAVVAVERYGVPGPVDRWRAARDAVKAEVLERGFDRERGTFTQAYGSRGLDAATLLLPQLGFLPPDDPRVTGTVDTIQRELAVDGFILRYDTEAHGGVDGLPGGEGAFLACSFWLADALALQHRYDEAEELFERLVGLRNDVGLLAEEYDPIARRQLGNVPQAFSHVGLVNTAHQLQQPRRQPQG